MSALTPLEHDTLTEFLNLGLGRAARSLSEMVDQEIVLAVPELQVLPMSAVVALLEREHIGSVSSVRQTMSGPLRGDIVTIFASDDSLELVRALLKEDVPKEALVELELEAVTEVGNVIQNACVAAIANELCLEIQTTIPTSEQGSVCEVLLDRAPDWNTVSVLFFRVNFRLAHSNVTGYLVLTLSIKSGSQFRTHLERYVAQLTQNGVPHVGT